MEIVAATQWLPHTTRAALTGLRHKGFVLDKSKREDGTTLYRISSAPASETGKTGLMPCRSIRLLSMTRSRACALSTF